MMNRMMATPQATAPICSNMPMRSRPPPSCANAGVASASIPSPAYATCEIFRTFITASSAKWLKSIGGLAECELHRDGHDDRHRDAIQQGRREHPLPHRVERRLVEQRD